MATYRKRGKSWQAIVDYKGVYQAKSFPLKTQAERWATSLEASIADGGYIVSTGHTVGELLDDYCKKVSIKKKGYEWESLRINLLKQLQIQVGQQQWVMGEVPLSIFDEKFVAAYRDERIKVVSGSTVHREWNIFSNAFNIAIKEWKWIKNNPFSNVKRPPKNPPRDRLATKDEITRLMHSAGFSLDTPPENIKQRVMAAWLYSSYTAKRCKEITQLTHSMVHLDEKYVEVGDDTKTGARDVPLFKEAETILKHVMQLGLEPVFGLKESQVDSNWRKLTKMAMVENLTFHDAKHCACTWMASEKKVPIFDLARIVGTRDLKVLMIYYNMSASAIAKKYDL